MDRCLRQCTKLSIRISTDWLEALLVRRVRRGSAETSDEDGFVEESVIKIMPK